jgi:exopolyphosphatase/guanosine-5'-triphosphate,3'-diphosphate pyrophosphatase
MSPRRSAFFDIGTNTVLCLIAEVRDTGRFRVLDDLATITRLGEGVDQNRRIQPVAEQRTLEVLRRYRSQCDNLGVTEFVAVGTSALRDAENSAAVCARFRAELGFDIRVITGHEEAAYSFLAVERGLELPTRETLVIDIGGGSTEFIYGDASGLRQAESIELGSVRLTERFLHSDPVAPDEVAQLESVIERGLDRLAARGIGRHAELTLVGIAGTFTTIAAMEQKLRRYSHRDVHGSRLTLGAVKQQRERLQRKTIAARRRIAGLEPERADVIFAGALVAEKTMCRYGADALLVSDQGVRYGLLHEAARPR